MRSILIQILVFLILLVFLIVTDTRASPRLAYIPNNPCSEDDLNCMVETLEGYLSIKPSMEEKSKAIASSALSVGYAHLGNIEKAEKYRMLSEKLVKINNLDGLNSGRLVEQYILQKEHNLVLSILKKEETKSDACHSAVQVVLSD